MAQTPCRFTTASFEKSSPVPSVLYFCILSSVFCPLNHDSTYWLNKEKNALKSFLKAHNYKPRLAETPKKTYNLKHV